MIHKAVCSSDKYPFTAESTLRLSAGVVLPAGAIYGARFQPTIPNGFGSLYIARVTEEKLSDGLGTLHIYDTILGDVGIRAEFKLKDPDIVNTSVYGAVYQFGKYCGCIAATEDLLPFLTTKRILEGDEFVFVNSVYIPRIGEGYIDQNEAVIVTGSGEPVQSIIYGDGFGTDGELQLNEVGLSANPFVPIKRVLINGGTDGAWLKGTSINIGTTTGSKLRVVTDVSASTIRLGVVDDLPTQ